MTKQTVFSSVNSILKNTRLVGIAIVAVMMISGFLLLKQAPKAHAACQPSGTTYGTDTITTNVSSAETYNLWVRMQVPSTSANSIMMEVDGGDCYVVGGSATIPANTWTWVDYQNGATGSPVTIPLTVGSHVFKFYGTNAGVGVDRVLLLTDNSICGSSNMPTGTGDNCTPTPSVSIPYYMQAGGTGFTDSKTGVVWQPDQYYTQDNSYGSTGGVSQGGDGSSCTTTLANSNCTTQTITGTTDPQIYQTERWGAFHYDIPVNNGTYTVVLKFAEINPASGTRVFTVSTSNTAANTVACNGAQVLLCNFNISQSAGGNYVAYDQTFNITVTNGDLNLAFVPSSNSAKLAGLEILSSAPPTVAITAPTSGATVSGKSVILSANATASGTATISNVQFAIDGTAVATVTTSPYTYSWDSTTVADGSHSLTATATDSNGLTGTAQETFSVSNNACTTAPTAPSRLKDTDSAPLPANKVDLSWRAGAAGANCTLAGYNIYRNGSLLSSTTATTYSDTTVAPSTTYTYQVAAYDTAGHVSNKIPATPLSVTTGSSCSTSGGAPTTPTNLSESGNSYTTISMTWSASTDSNGCNLSGYHIYNVVGGVATHIGDTTGTATSYTATTLTSSSTYSYYVVAFDSGGNVSSASNTVSMTTEADNQAPTVPANVMATANSNPSVDLSWSASSDLPNPGGTGVAGYYIIRNGVTLGEVLSPTTSYTDNSVSYSASYSYVVQAVDNVGNLSADSSTANVTTPQQPDKFPPTTPTNVVATPLSGSEIGLSWTASTDEVAVSGYNVYQNGSTTPVNGSTLVTTTTYAITNLSADTTYSYTIVAVNTAGLTSAPSTVASTTTLNAGVSSAVDGIVTSKLSGNPISGVSVTTPDHQNLSALTNGEGQYFLPVTPGQRYYYYGKGSLHGDALLNVKADTIVTKNIAIN